VTSWLERHQQDRRSRRQLQGCAREAAAHVAVRQLREELAVLVPQLFAAEQSALLFWRYQVARITMAAKRVLVRRGLLDTPTGCDGHPRPAGLSGLD
jgi:hypothetical protein